MLLQYLPSFLFPNEEEETRPPLLPSRPPRRVRLLPPEFEEVMRRGSVTGPGPRGTLRQYTYRQFPRPPAEEQEQVRPLVDPFAPEPEFNSLGIRMQPRTMSDRRREAFDELVDRSIAMQQRGVIRPDDRGLPRRALDEFLQTPLGRATQRVMGEHPSEVLDTPLGRDPRARLGLPHGEGLRLPERFIQGAESLPRGFAEMTVRGEEFIRSFASEEYQNLTEPSEAHALAQHYLAVTDPQHPITPGPGPSDNPLAVIARGGGTMLPSIVAGGMAAKLGKTGWEAMKFVSSAAFPALYGEAAQDLEAAGVDDRTIAIAAPVIATIGSYLEALVPMKLGQEIAVGPALRTATRGVGTMISHRLATGVEEQITEGLQTATLVLARAAMSDYDLSWESAQEIGDAAAAGFMTALAIGGGMQTAQDVGPAFGAHLWGKLQDQSGSLFPGESQPQPPAQPTPDPTPEELTEAQRIVQEELDPDAVREAFEKFDESQSNVTFEEVQDALPEAVARRADQTPVIERIQERRREEGLAPMSREQLLVADAVSRVAREKGLQLRRRSDIATEVAQILGPEVVNDESLHRGINEEIDRVAEYDMRGPDAARIAAELAAKRWRNLPLDMTNSASMAANNFSAAQMQKEETSVETYGNPPEGRYESPVGEAITVPSETIPTAFAASQLINHHASTRPPGTFLRLERLPNGRTKISLHSRVSDPRKAALRGEVVDRHTGKVLDTEALKERIREVEQEEAERLARREERLEEAFGPGRGPLVAGDVNPDLMGFKSLRDLAAFGELAEGARSARGTMDGAVQDAGVDASVRSASQLMRSDLKEYNEETLGRVITELYTEDEILDRARTATGIDGTDALDVAQQIVDKFMASWADSAAGSNPLSLALQHAANELLGGTAATDHLLDNPYISRNLPIARMFIRAAYMETQRILADYGYGPNDPLILARGAKFRSSADGSAYGSGEFENMQPLNSFSVRFDKGIEFTGTDGVLLIGAIPRRNIITSAFSGCGCLPEGEYLVAGGKYPPGAMEVILVGPAREYSRSDFHDGIRTWIDENAALRKKALDELPDYFIGRAGQERDSRIADVMDRIHGDATWEGDAAVKRELILDMVLDPALDQHGFPPAARGAILTAAEWYIPIHSTPEQKAEQITAAAEAFGITEEEARVMLLGLGTDEQIAEVYQRHHGEEKFMDEVYRFVATRWIDNDSFANYVEDHGSEIPTTTLLQDLYVPTVSITNDPMSLIINPARGHNLLDDDMDPAADVIQDFIARKK